MLAKGWDSDLRIPHMFFRFPPLLLATYDLRLENNAMLYALGRWRRIGWRNVCGAPTGKDRAIQKAGWGRHPGPKRMVFPAGASYGFKNVLQKN